MTQRTPLLLKVLHQYNPAATAGIRLQPMPWTNLFLQQSGAIIRPVPQGLLLLIPTHILKTEPGTSPAIPDWLDFAVLIDDPELIPAAKWPDKPHGRNVWLWKLTTPTPDPNTTDTCVITSGSRESQPGITEDAAPNPALTCTLTDLTLRPESVHGIARVSKDLLTASQPPNELTLQLRFPAATFKPTFAIRLSPADNSNNYTFKLIDTQKNKVADFEPSPQESGVWTCSLDTECTVSVLDPSWYFIAPDPNGGTPIQIPVPRPRLNTLNAPVVITIKNPGT
jgi:hypothetical protein